jgi:hypothetical protein
VVLEFLLGAEGEQAIAVVEGLATEERENEMMRLRNQRTEWRDNPAQYRLDHHDHHMHILQQGTEARYCRDYLFYTGWRENSLLTPPDD